jgi:hypothetical protein
MAALVGEDANPAHIAMADQFAAVQGASNKSRYRIG